MELEVDIEGLKLSAKTWGDKKDKPVLAIHGWLDNANTFDKIAPLISQNIYLIAIDLTGHGFSDHRDANGSYYLWDYALDILKVIEVLKIKKLTILAHSMGTGVASLIAGAMPDLISRLIFIDGLGAPFVIDDKDIVSNFTTSVKQLKMAKRTKLYGFSSVDTILFTTKEEAIKGRMNTSIGTISYDASKCLVERSLQKVSNGYRWSHDPRIVLPECYRMTESQAQSFISSISCKTLVILGKQGLFSNGMFNSRLNKFKYAKIYWIEGGHHLHLEEMHHEISALINQFLQTEF